MKKYELLKKDTKELFGKTLYRIKALKNFGDVKKGDLGGYIEKEENLSHDGNAWVFDNARVYDDAWVYDNARVSGNAEVSGNARVRGNAIATCKTLNLNYLLYNITLTDNHIQIGCTQFTYEVAIKLSKKDCGTLFTSDEFQEMWKYKKLLLELIKVKRPDLFKKEGK